MQLILCHKNLLLQFFSILCTVSLLRNHNSNLCSDHNNKINVLPQYAVPLYCSNFPELKESEQSSYFRCLWSKPKTQDFSCKCFWKKCPGINALAYFVCDEEKRVWYFFSPDYWKERGKCRDESDVEGSTPAIHIIKRYMDVIYQRLGVCHLQAFQA